MNVDDRVEMIDQWLNCIDNLQLCSDTEFVNLCDHIPIMKKLLICFVLFLTFYAYRIHFWEDFQRHGLHALINAMADTGLSVVCGILIFKLQARNRFFQRWVFLLSAQIMILFSFALFAVHTKVYQAFNMLTDDFRPMFNALCFQLLDSGAIVITGAFVFMLHLFSSEKKNMQADMRQLAFAKNKAELNALRSKIEPHFIFNGLNSIYHEIEQDTAAAKARLLQFSDIMRYHLQYAACDKVNFDIELQYLKSYINFQFNRTSDFLELDQAYQVRDSETEIEPLLILPFIENAFKFCSAAGMQKGRIQVNIQFSSDALLMELSNTYDPVYRQKQHSNGFGIENVVKRLNLLYPGRFILKIEDMLEQHLYSCRLEIRI